MVVTIQSLGQNFLIPDTNFRRCLKESHPEIFDGEYLIIELAKNVTEVECLNNLFNRIENLTGIEYFVNATYLSFPNNAISVLPDISSLSNLIYLDVGNNFLTSLPDLSQTKLGNDPNSELSISFNYLTFEDIIPIASKVYGNLNYSNQNAISEGAIKEIMAGQTFVYNLTLDESVAGNSYTWYHDDIEMPGLNIKTLTINNVKASDAGTYTCKITNSNIPDLTIGWGFVLLSLSTNQNAYIPDDNFRQCLKESYPQAFDGDLLILDSAKNIERIDCVQKNITNIVGVEYFTKITYLDFEFNSIQTIPDISMLKELQLLDFSYNDISSLPDLSSNTKLSELYFMANNFTVFPNIPASLNPYKLYFSINNLATIPDLSHLTNLTVLGVGYNPLTSLGPLHKYQALKGLEFAKTNLSTFPDLSQNINLENISFLYNPQFLNWPDLTANVNLNFINCAFNKFKSIPSLAAHTKLVTLYCSNNELNSLPDLSMLAELYVLDCSNNNLASLPDLSQTKFGDSSHPYCNLRISNNHLTFEDLIPVVVSKTYSYLEYAPQALIQNTSVQKIIGDSFTINIGVDNAVNTNSYTWYRDNVEISTTNANTLTIGDLKTGDSGVYTCKISNTQIPDIIIDWGSVTLTVSVPTLFIPDDNFRQCLKDQYPQMFIGELLIADSAKIIVDIGCGYREVESVSGIENFINANFLNFAGNKIHTLPDISALKDLILLDLRENELTSLPDLSQNTKLAQLICYANKFSVFPDLPVLTNLTFIEFSNNQLTTIPDLSHLANLDQLNIGFNPLTSIGLLPINLRELDFSYCNFNVFPDLSQNINLQHLYFIRNLQLITWPDISANTNLTHIDCRFNNFKSIPSLAAHSKLTRFDCANNSLEELPDLSMLPDLESLDCSNNNLTDLPDLSQTKLGKNLGVFLTISNNHLSFEDLIPVVSKSFTQLWYKPQILQLQNTNIAKQTGESFICSVGFDGGVSTNTYTWYHDDVEIATTNTNSLTIDNLKSSNAGVYTCKITNAEIPDITLEWKQITLTVTCPTVTLSEKDFNVILINASCVEGGKIIITGNGNRSLEGLTFELIQVNTSTSVTSASPVIHNLSDGTYQLNVIADGCSQQWPLKLLINKPSCNDPVFSPNNDGVADDYYIPFHGIAKIYDRNGALINELSIPSAWDGTDHSGVPVPMGTYVITCGGQKEIFITIIR
jgi:Leucine-rich repeat (LRR) protein